MEVTQDELLEQSKISALESGIYKTRLAKTTAMYASLYEQIKEAEENAESDDVSKALDFYRTFPDKIEF